MRILRSLARVLLATILTLLTLAGVSAAGTNTSMNPVLRSDPPIAAPPQGWPGAAVRPAT